MILLIGQVARDQTEREAFQEIDFRRMFGPVTKWTAEIDDARRIPELVSQAFYRATSGRPGPVALALPEDMLTDVVETADAGPYKKIEAHPGPADMARLRDLLAAAKRPLMIVGGGGWSAQSAADLTHFAEANHVPVAGSFRCQDIVDNLKPCLCRRRRHRHQSEAGRARAHHRPAARGRRAHGRDDDQRLHPARHPGAEAAHGPCLSGLRRARPRLSALAADQCRHGGFRSGGQGA